MRHLFGILCLGIALWKPDASAQSPTNKALPGEIVFVPHAYAYRLARHPTLPVLYLGLGSTPESKNLVTFRLDDSGKVLTNSLRAFDDYFTDDGKNPTNRYSVLGPIVLPEEKVLLLAAQPASYPIYDANSNAQHVAAVALDDQGQPGKLLKAFRTTHTEASIAAIKFDPSARRLYVSYSSYWGWISVGKDGVPTREFHMLPLPWNLWEMAVVSEWQRIIGVARGTDLCNFRLNADGNGVEFYQMSLSPTGTFGGLEVSPRLCRIYVLDGPDFKTISVYRLDKEGRFRSLPRRFTIGETTLLRLDSQARRLYSVTQAGTIRVQPLDAEGYPKGTAEVFQVSCGSIRDVIVDEPRGKVYVACTEAPK